MAYRQRRQFFTMWKINTALRKMQMLHCNIFYQTAKTIFVS